MPESLEAALKEANAAMARGQTKQCQTLLRDLPERLTANELRELDQLARNLFSAGHAQEAVELFENASTILERQLDREAEPQVAALFVQLLLNLAFARLERQEYRQAGNAGRKAVAYARNMAAQLPQLLASALFGLSAVHYRQKDWDGALELVLEAKAIWKDAGNLEKVATCMNNLGRIHEEKNMPEQGIYWHRKAVEYRRKLPDRHDLAFSLGNLGVALGALGQWAEAVAALTEATEVYAALGLAQGAECQAYRQNLEICRKALNG